MLKQFLDLRQQAKIAAGILDRRVHTGPWTVQIDLTNRCNNDCIACWCNSPLLGDKGMPPALRDASLPWDKLAAIVDELSALGVRSIYFTGGGEPFMHPRILDLIGLIKGKGIHLDMSTNFTLVDEKTAGELVRLGLDHLNLSLWAGSPEVYAVQHPNKPPGTFERMTGIVDHIVRLKKERGRTVPGLGMYNVINVHNYRDVRNMLEYAFRHRMDHVHYTFVDTVPGRTDHLALDAGQLGELHEQARALPHLAEEWTRRFHHRPGLVGFETFLARTTGSGAAKADYDHDLLAALPSCYAGWSFARILANGDVNSCLKSFKIPVGNVHREDFTGIWFGKAQEEFRRHTIDYRPDDPYFLDMGNDAATPGQGCRKCCDNLGLNLSIQGELDKLGPVRRKGISILGRLLGAALLFGLPLSPVFAAGENQPPPGEPFTLSRCLELAGSRSLEVEGAEEKLRGAELSYEGVLPRLWPRVSLAVDYVQKADPPPQEPDPVRPYLALSKTTLNDWSKIRETRTAVSTLYTARSDLARARMESQRTAGERYYDLLLAQGQADLARSRAQEASRAASEQEEKFRLGVIPEIELLRARTGASRLKADLLSREGDLARARQALASALCLPPGLLPLAAPDDAAEGGTPDQDSCTEAAVRDNPELAVAREALGRMRELEDSARMTRWPQLSAQGFVGYNPNDVDRKTDWVLVLTLSKDLYDGGETGRRIGETEAEARRLEIEVTRREREIREKMESLFLEWATAGQVLREAVERLLETTRKGHQRGVLPARDLLDAQALAADHESSFALARIRLDLVRFRILLLAGLLPGAGGIEMSPRQPPTGAPAGTGGMNP